MTAWEQLGIPVTKQAVIDYIYCRKHIEKIKAGQIEINRKHGNTADWALYAHPEWVVEEIEGYFRGPVFRAYSGDYSACGVQIINWLRANWKTFKTRSLKD
jgi:hypothetical protein